MIKTQFWLSLLTLTNVVVNTQTAQAQTYQPTNRAPVSDNTLGTQVSGTGGNFDITGGVSKGQTLFHSFTDFSVPTSGQANFLNPVGNRDIITRVTGNLFSDINGSVNTNGANFFLINPNGIVFGTNAQSALGNSKGIIIVAREIELSNGSRINSSTSQKNQVDGTGNAGDITFLNNTDLVNGVSTISFDNGTAGNISLNTKGNLFLSNTGISSASNSVGGGNITVNASNKLLMSKNSFISTNSIGTGKNSNGGNIVINSPLIVALPGNNDIKGDANQGTGGNIKIVSQGLFGIQYRPKGQASPRTNDITASSTFGRDGAVNIDTPGTDPGKDSTELPKAPTDASNQISQVCGANTRENKLTVTGRGGLPPNPNDPLTSDVVWQDARAVSGQQVASSATTNPAKLIPPAVGWVFDGKGKVTLVAAATQGQPTGTSVICPSNN